MALSNNERAGKLSPLGSEVAAPVETLTGSAPGAAERGWLLLVSLSRIFLGRGRDSEVDE